KKLIEGHAGGDFDQPTQHINTEAILPPRAGTEKKRHRGQPLHVVGDRAIVGQQSARNVGGLVLFTQSFVPVVGQAGSVRKQVLYGDFPRGRNRIGVAAAGRLHENFGVLEFGKVFRNRVLQLELALFIEHHDGQAGNRLGHGADAENGVRAHRLVGFAVQRALRFEIDDLAVTRHQRNRAGDALVVGVWLVLRRDALLSFGGTPHGLGLGRGQLLRRRSGRNQRNREQQKQ